jgi:DNA-directed RNA polymerase alpha subunit
MAKRARAIRGKTKATGHADASARMDQEWAKIGLSSPARQALVDAKLYKVSDLRRITEADLRSLPGLGKSAVARIKGIMEAKKIRFL